jgi:hypothetical protein
MNKDVLLSLAKLKGIESAEIISTSIFSAISEDAQETYSEQMDQATDHGYANFSTLYMDLIQNEYSEEDAEKKLIEVVEPMIEAYAHQAADIQQISYSTEVYEELREQISQSVYSQIESDLEILGAASNLTMAEFAASLQEQYPDEEMYTTFDEIDLDGDGTITRSEWLQAGRKDEEFDLIDKNHDGVIDRAEFEDYVLE